MAQLKDTIVSGSLRATDAVLTNQLQAKTIQAPLASDDTTFTAGTSGQALVSDGTKAHWANVPWANIDSKPSTFAPSAHQHAGSDINSGTVSASHGGTGKTTLNESANALINALTEGSSPAQANDYIVAQYAGGGTVTTTYHRRKLSNIFKALTASNITTALGYTPPQTNTTYTATTTSIGSASAGTAIPADDITNWSAGTLPAATVSGENLTITFGSLPSLSYTAKSIPNISVTSTTVATGITEN